MCCAFQIRSVDTTPGIPIHGQKTRSDYRNRARRRWRLWCIAVSQWKNFDWDPFLTQTHSVSAFHILHGIALIYIAYVLRAVRWKIFLRPVRPQASSIGLVARYR